jgi:hypothetical protein
MRLSRLNIAHALMSIALVAASAAWADCTAPASRHVIKFYQYAGAESGEASQMFSTFRKVVDEEVSRFATSLATSNKAIQLATEPDYGASAGYVVGHLTQATSVRVMQGDPRLLVLLDGRVQFAPDKKLYVVHSDIFILPAVSSQPQLPFSEDFLLTPYQHDAARSLHLAAMFLAMARDAAEHSCRLAQVTFLSKAAETAQDAQHAHVMGAQGLFEIIRSEQRGLGLLP